MIDIYKDTISKHYDSSLTQFGATHKGLNWPNQNDIDLRYKIMLELIDSFLDLQKFSLLDLGCGFGGIIPHIEKKFDKYKIDYCGIDISNKMILEAKKKYPDYIFKKFDLLTDKSDVEQKYDFIIMNGVFTVKYEVDNTVMFEKFKNYLLKASNICTKGFAFNVMSTNVDWMRDDLFYLSYDSLADFLTKNISRNFVFRSDYNLYEFTTYVYK